MKWFINFRTLRLARIGVFEEGERDCCCVVVKFGWLPGWRGASAIMSPGEAEKEMMAMEKTLHHAGFWPLWFWLLTALVYATALIIIIDIFLLSF